MTEIEIYIEAIKHTRTLYIEELNKLENTLTEAYIKGWINTHGVDRDKCISIMRATAETAKAAINITTDKRLEALNNEK